MPTDSAVAADLSPALRLLVWEAVQREVRKVEVDALERLEPPPPVD
jgi:hypothetical protein